MVIWVIPVLPLLSGHTNKKNAQLLKVTEEALFAGIKQAVPGNTVGDIGHAVESYVDLMAMMYSGIM